MEFRTKTIIFFILSVIFALSSAYIFLTHVQETEQAMGEIVQVMIAKEDIPINGTLSPDKLETIAMPRKYINPSLITDPQGIANQIALVPIKKQDVIIRSMIRPKDQMPADVRVVYLREPIAVFDGSYAVGDRADLLVTTEQGQADITSFLKSDVVVADIVRGKEERITAMGVILTIQEAPVVIQALNQAKEVRVLKRPLGAKEGTSEDGNAKNSLDQ